MVTDRLRLNCGDDAGEMLADLVGRIAADNGLGTAEAYRLRLAADELATNIATHGYHGKPGPLGIAAGSDAEWVWLRLEDEAPPFDPREHCVPPGRNGEEPRLGGYGIFLALTGVDRFGYDHVGGRNRNTLSMRRPVALAGGDGGTDDGADGAGRR
jgi:anti-sigma regulatory factor (Ser/Thr protein kinase)